MDISLHQNATVAGVALGGQDTKLVRNLFARRFARVKKIH
jgi:hypothetical protein